MAPVSSAGLLVEELISRDLFGNESIVGFVLVEGTNDVVSIAPSVGALPVVGETGAVSIPCNIEPVATPLLAVVRTREQTIDHRRKRRRIVSRVVQECVDLPGSRRQADEIERDAANQRTPIRVWRGLQSSLGQTLVDKGVDRTLGV